MVLEEDIKCFSKEWNLPAEYVRREIEEQDQFVKEVLNTELERESDPEVVKRIMAEYVRRSEAASVPYVKNRYLYQSAVIAAMYIYAHHDNWLSGVLPDFYKTARKQAYTALMADFDFDELMVYTMLRLYRLKDVRSIIGCIKQVNRYVYFAKKYSSYYISDYQQAELYCCYETVCFQASLELCNNESIDLTQKIRLFNHLTKLKTSEIRMLVYFSLFWLYVHNCEREDDNSGCDDINPETGNAYFEEYLAKAYTVMECKLESLNLALYAHQQWLSIAVEYANWMTIDHQGPIPYNPVEAEKILRYAANVDIEKIASRANYFLQKYFNE